MIVPLMSRATMRELVLTLCKTAPCGVTADELAEMLDCTHNHVAPRMTELKKAGLLTKVGTRKTRAGCTASVFEAVREAVAA